MLTMSSNNVICSFCWYKCMLHIAHDYLQIIVTILWLTASMQKNIVGCPFQVLILRLIVVYCMHVAYAPLHTRPIDEFLITDEMKKKWVDDMLCLGLTSWSIKSIFISHGIGSIRCHSMEIPHKQIESIECAKNVINSTALN